MKISYHPRREVGISFMIDTNSINAKHLDENLNRLYVWRDNHVVSVIMARETVRELQGYRAGNKEAAGYIHVAGGTDPGAPETIRQVVFPEGYSEDPDKRRNEIVDVRIIASAKQNGSALITLDGAILKRAKELGALGIRVYMPAEAVEQVATLIAVRDKNDLFWHQNEGKELPDWHGKD